MLSKCSKLAQKEYKRRHDWFGTKIDWKICRKYGIEVKEKWYEHKPKVAIENVRYYETSQYKRIMKYMEEDQMTLQYRKIKFFVIQ